jgi:hypothetical protein
MTTIDEMRQDVEKLLEQHASDPDDLHVHWIEDRNEAHALDPYEVGLFELHIPIIRSGLDYATCLHEIGHHKGRHQRSKNVATRERWAWQWARDHALVWTAEMEQDAQASLQWYEERKPSECQIIEPDRS